MTDDGALRHALVERATDFGATVTPEEFRITRFAGPLPAGISVFRAAYGSGEERGFITGVQRQGEDPNTLTQDAVAELFAHWQDDGALDPEAMAKAFTFVFAPEDPDVVLADQAAVDDARLPEHLAGKVVPPAIVDVDGRPAVQFWWIRRGQPSRMTFVLLADGTVDVQQKMARDFLEAD
jgi:hypothetical protein